MMIALLTFLILAAVIAIIIYALGKF